MEGSVLTITPSLTTFFAVHEAISALVMLSVIAILVTGYLQWKRRTVTQWHRKISDPLIVLWGLAFLSGEVVYVGL